MTNDKSINRREMLGIAGKSAAAIAIMPALQAKIFAQSAGAAATHAAINGVAGVDRIVVLPGKTYLRGWAGHGEPPQRGPRRGAAADSMPPAPDGPPPKVRWSKQSGPGRVSFKTTRANAVVAERLFTARVPTAGAETPHLTLLFDRSLAHPPAKAVEVVVEKFAFLP